MAEPTPDARAKAISLTVSAETPGVVELPEPWIFDGTRRVYVMGKPAQRNGWIARAVDVSDKTFTKTVPLEVGEGDTPVDAVLDLMMRLQGIETDASDDAVFIARGDAGQ